MADSEATIYAEKLCETVDVPEPNNLIQGSCIAADIRLLTAGEYKCGELLMSSGNNEFVTATAAGVASAAELCLLTRDIEIPEGSVAIVCGYFEGTFSASSVVLSYETEENNHDTLIEAIRLPLRVKGIYLV